MRGAPIWPRAEVPLAFGAPATTTNAISNLVSGPPCFRRSARFGSIRLVALPPTGREAAPPSPDEAHGLKPVPGGEITDGLAVWLPEEKTVFTGNLLGALYGQLPHLYDGGNAIGYVSFLVVVLLDPLNPGIRRAPVQKRLTVRRTQHLGVTE